jgi:hypothetical protein
MGQTMDRPNRPMATRNYWLIGIAALAIILIIAFAISANRTEVSTVPEPARTMDQITPQNTITTPSDVNQNTTRDTNQTPPTGP